MSGLESSKRLQSFVTLRIHTYETIQLKRLLERTLEAIPVGTVKVLKVADAFVKTFVST